MTRLQVEGPRKREQSESAKVDMLAAAYLKAEGRKQQEIAEILKLSPVTVCRHVEEARQQKFLHQPHVRFLRHKVPRELMEKVLRRTSPRDLQGQLDKFAKDSYQYRRVSLRVFDCGPATTDHDWMQHLAELAAPVVRDLLLRSHSCGVTWGGMLKVAVSQLHHLSFPPPETREIIPFIPLSGEPLGREREAFPPPAWRGSWASSLTGTNTRHRHWPWCRLSFLMCS